MRHKTAYLISVRYVVFIFSQERPRCLKEENMWIYESHFSCEKSVGNFSFI